MEAREGPDAQACRLAMRDAVFRPTGSVKMNQEDKALMLDFYRSDTQRLEGILDRELKTWLV
jgi:hypothetical protein